MARSTTDSCCLTLPLIVERWQADRLEKRFELARQIYNSMLSDELKRLRYVEHLPEYKKISARMTEIYREGNKQSKEYKQLFQKRKKMLEDNEFSKFAFTTHMKKYYKWCRSNISSMVAQAISENVWRAFEKYFYSNGKRLHFKKIGSVTTVAGKGGASGPREIRFKDGYVLWNGLRLKVKLDESNVYEQQMLEHRIRFCRILKKPDRRKNHYYVQFVLEGRPEIKIRPDTGEALHPVGVGRVGIDIGPQTIAYAAECGAGLRELAEGVGNIEREKRLLQRKLDRSRRATNPNNYNADGTIRRGVKLTKNKSNRYLAVQRELAYVYQRQAAMRKQNHIALANELLALGDTFFVEDMPWKGLAKKAKKTEISPKTGKYKRKKRFGKSLGNKAPATLIMILDNKLKSLGLDGVQKIPTTARASQYNHITQTYTQKTLSQRWNTMEDGTKIQRDLYSAFLLQHINEDNKTFNQQTLEEDYPAFQRYHDRVIVQLQNNPHNVASMGIRSATHKRAE